MERETERERERERERSTNRQPEMYRERKKCDRDANAVNSFHLLNSDSHPDTTDNGHKIRNGPSIFLI